VTAANTVGAASSTETVCIDTAITDITHTTTGATGIGTATGLPTGVTAAWASNTITISGTPSAAGTFNYSIPLTGGCGTVNATGTITVTAANTVGAASSTETVCINTAITDITHTTTGATGIETATGLPTGVTATWASNTITISGTPSAAGTFNYSIPLTGGCGTVNATGTITVTAANTVSAASSSPTVCINTSITNITHTTTGATGIGVATGLPTGVTAAWASNTITISGTPSVAGTFNYSIPLTGGCGTVNATGTITVNALPNATITRTGDTLTATESGATYQWYTCSAGPVYTIISGATSQSYVVTAIGSYAVEVTKNGCTTMSTCFDVTTLSNNSFNLTQLTYYPNPVISNFTVTYTRAITSIQVYDINGRLVKNMKTNNNEVNVDMSDVAASVYIVKVFADDTMGAFKIIKRE
ncbi:T9SS type A sorting domain-containing protein, partial [Flavobacterium sp.]|uniref:T9SS type A sorting domain-containing protein n=1 Tax=Flavobacterium sp. TaxID=239 RepID=UPI002FDE5D4D